MVLEQSQGARVSQNIPLTLTCDCVSHFVHRPLCEGWCLSQLSLTFCVHYRGCWMYLLVTLELSLSPAQIPAPEPVSLCTAGICACDTGSWPGCRLWGLAMRPVCPIEGLCGCFPPPDHLLGSGSVRLLQVRGRF